MGNQSPPFVAVTPAGPRQSPVIEFVTSGKLGSQQSPFVVFESLLDSAPALNAVVFANTATYVLQPGRAVVTPVVFDQVATLNFVIQRSAGTSVAFGQDAQHNFKLEDAANAVAFAQDAQHNYKFESAETQVVFDQTLDLSKEIGRAAETAISFFDFIRTNVIAVTAGNAIAFDQDVTTNAVYERAPTTPIKFQHAAKRTFFESVSTAIVFAQTLFREHGAETSIVFTQSAVAQVGPAVSTDVLFQQAVSFNLDSNHTPSTAIVFGQAVVAWIERNCDLYEYTPFGAMPTAPILTVATFIRLDDGVTQLDLRNPEFGNGEQLTTNQVVNRSRGGSLNPFASTIWPRTSRLKFTINTLQRSEAVALQTFYQQSLGLEITLTDQENRQWTGLLLSVGEPITDQGGLVTNCKYQTEIEFIGAPA